MHLLRRRGIAAPILLGIGGLLGTLFAGCGSNSSSATARIRGVDLSVNGSTTGVLINQTAVGGDLTFGQVSSYNYVQQGISTFSFTTTSTAATTTVSGVATGIVVPPDATLQLNNNSFYTAYLIGRADVAPLTVARADPRFLQTVVAGDKGAAANYLTTPYSDPPSGEANVRILNAAPDSGPVDILIGGKIVFSSATYPILPAGITGTTNTAVNPMTAYSPQTSGNLSVQVNAAGTSTVLVPPTNISVSGGQSYTVAVTETAITPTYGLATQNDQ
ncbi:MAG: DUF4397 domain-containing protein [Janthinobacterium lividum]